MSGPRNCSNYNRTEETTCFEEGVSRSKMGSIKMIRRKMGRRKMSRSKKSRNKMIRSKKNSINKLSNNTWFISHLK